MKGLGKENYASLRFLSSYVALLLCMMISTTSWSQFCDIKFASEPTQIFKLAVPESDTQSASIGLLPWSSTAANGAKINFPNSSISQKIIFSNFKFKIPQGAKINGYKVSFTGRSQGLGNAYDFNVQLVSDKSISQNFAGKSYNSKNLFIKSSTSRKWYYGGNNQNWGLNLSAEDINDPNFALELQLANSSTKAISAFIDDVTLEVFYTEAATFCTTDCFPVYTKTDHPSNPFYKWTIPQGFELISRSDRHYIIDLKAPNVLPGLYNIKVDALDATGKIIQSCEREIRIRKCEPSIIGDRVWNDINFNGLQDPTEPGVSGIKLNLRDLKNNIVKSTTTDASGNYKFTGIVEGDYKIDIELPTTFVTTINTPNDSLNSDLIFNTNCTKSLRIEFNENIKNLDFGLVKKLAIGDFVWVDDNCNGLQDPAEQGIEGVKILLFNEVNKLVDSTNTDKNGKYVFNTIASKYRLTFAIPNKHIPIPSLPTNLSLNSDIDDKGNTKLIDFTNQSNDNSVDAGFIKFGSIGDFVWNDLDNDGNQDTDERGTEGLSIILVNEKGNPIDTVKTDMNGKYLFKDVVPGKYSVQTRIPSGSLLAKSNSTGNTSSLKTLVNGIAKTDTFTLKSGVDKLNIDLGYAFALGKICGKIWYDANANGLYELGEELVGELPVKLTNTKDSTIENILTDINGIYCFDSLKIGTYIVQFEIEDDIQFTKPNAGNDAIDSDVLETILKGFSPLLQIKDGRDSIKNIDAGLIRRSIIGDFVWEDKNINGIQDIDEIGIEGIKIVLLDSIGNVIDSTTTDIDGEYLFQKIVKGSYQIKATKLQGYEFTKSNIGSDDDLDSEVNVFGFSNLFTVALGDDNFGQDVGMIKNISIGDFVFNDVNGNGLQDEGDLPLEDILIWLVNGIGEVVDSTRSDSFGKYLFEDVKPGLYKFIVKAPRDFKFSPFIKVAKEINSDADEKGMTTLIEFLEDDNSIDFGLYKTSCIQGFTWHDINENGIKEVQDTSFNNLVVLLTNTITFKTDTFITRSTSDFDFKFCDLEPGEYLIQYFSPRDDRPLSVPSDFELSAKSQDANANLIGEFIFSDTLKINSLSNVVKANAAFVYRPVNFITGTVWKDKNVNGLFDPNEGTMSDILVNLYDENGTLIRSTKSDSDGNYFFNEKLQKDFFVRVFIDSTLQFTTSNIEDQTLKNSVFEGLVDSAQTITINKLKLKVNLNVGLTFRSKLGDQVWLDTDKDGIFDSSESGLQMMKVDLFDEAKVLIASTTTDEKGKYGFSNLPKGLYFIQFNKTINSQKFTLKNITLTTGSDADSVGFTDSIFITPNNDNFDIDAGLTSDGGTIEGVVAIDIEKDSIITDEDRFIQLIVTLFNDKNEIIAETFSDSTGKYKFTNLKDGNYYVRFDSLPTYQIFTAKDKIDGIDITNERGFGSTKNFTIVEGKIISTNALFFDTRGSIFGNIFFDDEASEVIKATSEGIAFEIVHLNNVFGTRVDSVITDEFGEYNFSRVIPGKYIIEYPKLGNDIIPILETQFSDTISIIECGIVKDIFYGYTGFGNITGRAFIDANENNIDDDLLGLDNVIFVLKDANGNVIQTDTTTSNVTEFSFYQFNKVKAGTYAVSSIKPIGYVFSSANVNNNTLDDKDSDFKANTTLLATTDPFLLKANTTKTDLDLGLIRRSLNNSTISGIVWVDANTNGLRESSEIVREGIVITLCNADGSEVSKVNTNTKGEYSFSNLKEGFYFVKSNLLSGETSTLLNVGLDSLIDNDFNNLTPTKNSTSVFYLGIEENIKSKDLGIASEATIGSFVWTDNNSNGIQDIGEPGIPGVNISICTVDGKLVTKGQSGENGEYRISNIPVGKFIIKFQILDGFSPTLKDASTEDKDSDIDSFGKTGIVTLIAGYDGLIDAGFVKRSTIGNRVWVDFNANGVQNVGEPSKDSVMVSLFTESGVFVAKTITLTNSKGEAGQYIFNGIMPGKYYIKFDMPKGAIISPKNILDDTQDSDIDSTGKSDVFTLLSGVDNNDVDAGYYLPGCIGNRVWSDVNKNGLQDDGEPGISNVVLNLFKSNGDLLATQTTNQNGEYLFNNLPQGLFSIELSIPEGQKLTLIDQGDDDTKDSDFLANGSTPLISLAHAAKFLDLDAGLVPVGLIRENEFEIESVKAKELFNPKPMPNPSLNSIKFEVPFEHCILKIYDGNGSLIYTKDRYENNTMIDLQGFFNGIYNVVASDGRKSVFSKFIKVD
jgi:protocatechuate 3,4-dioxygenase beta subunit